MLTPARGTTADGHEIVVTGRVVDDRSGVRVTVNGTEATVNKDGSFTATLSAIDGITMIETHAIDTAGADVRDVRAVLAGDLSPTDGTVGAPIAARVGANGFARVGTALAATAQALDWNALALSMNPVYDSSGCNSARINIEQLSVGTIGVGLVPQTGVVDAAVTIDDVYVRMKVNFRALCISGSATATVRSSRAHINGDLALSATGGKLAATLPTSSVQLDGFSLDIGGIPGAIESLVKGEVRKAAEKALNNAIRTQVPPRASEALGGLLAQPIQAAILDKQTTFTITPDSVSIDSTGMIAAVEAKVLVAGGEGGMFVSTPMPLDAMTWGAGDLGVAIADDVVNQLMSGLWASGAIAPTLSLDGPAGILGAVLDPDARAIALDMKLPPMVRANNGVLELAIGDAILLVHNDAGAEIQSFALSITTTLSAAPTTSGGIAMTVGDPTVKAQMLTSVNGDTGGDAQLEGIVTGAWGLVGGLMGDALGNVPMPSVAGITLGAPSLTGQVGFLLVDVPIQ
jgi:hypothetical protein